MLALLAAAAVAAGTPLDLRLPDPYVEGTGEGAAEGQDAEPAVWPQPAGLEFGAEVLEVAPRAVFVFDVAGAQSAVLDAAVARTREHVFDALPRIPPEGRRDRDATPPTGTLEALRVVVADDRDDVLDVGTDEGYTLEVAAPVAEVRAATVFGALRGLETFSQLVSDSLRVRHAPVRISDRPRFPWRGLMLDTSRHFFTLSKIREVIDAMSFAKLNVLHWHVIDAQSFPLEVADFPLLAERGAYAYPYATYSPAEVREIRDYAHERGVRVVMEADMPGHAASWGGYPDLVVWCPSFSHFLDNIPLDISQEATYDVARAVLDAALAGSDDRFVHIGADEVVYGCWNESDTMRAWMDEMGFDDYALAENYFVEQMVGHLAAAGRRTVVWQEAFDNVQGTGRDLDPSVVVQVWINRATMEAALRAGHQVLLSQGFYLDVLVPGENHYRFQDTWRDMYVNELFDGIEELDEDLLDQVLGGEAAMWTEHTDETNLESRLWPQALAAAERFWSPASVNDPDDAVDRLSEMRCIMARRGVAAGPVTWPDFCPTPLYP